MLTIMKEAKRDPELIDVYKYVVPLLLILFAVTTHFSTLSIYVDFRCLVCFIHKRNVHLNHIILCEM